LESEGLIVLFEDLSEGRARSCEDGLVGGDGGCSAIDLMLTMNVLLSRGQNWLTTVVNLFEGLNFTEPKKSLLMKSSLTEHSSIDGERIAVRWNSMFSLLVLIVKVTFEN
jgi:hypothetical protein